MAMYESLREPLADAEGYLNRIGFRGPVRRDRECLDALIRAHLYTVPFENLNSFDLHRPVCLGIPDLYQKIVVQRRGGYCFELNALFQSLLEKLEFSCFAVAARVVMGKDELPPLSHRAIVVTIGEERLFCDVGFGGPCARGSLRLDDDGPQRAQAEMFRIMDRGEKILCQITPNAEKPILSFLAEPVDPVDFVTMNYFFSESPDSRFCRERMVHLLTDSGRISIENNVFQETGKTAVRLEGSAQLRSVLAERFKIRGVF